jgi:hypothetical protein
MTDVPEVYRWDAVVRLDDWTTEVEVSAPTAFEAWKKAEAEAWSLLEDVPSFTTGVKVESLRCLGREE